MPFYFMTDDDLRLMREFKRFMRNSKNGPTTRDERRRSPAQSPDIFIAKGSVTALSGTTPGSGTDLDVYRLGTSGDLEKVTLAGGDDMHRAVKNMKSDALADEYHLVVRDTSGNYWAVAGGGGGGGGCDPLNEFWTIRAPGPPTAGSFDISCSINGTREDVNIAYDDTASDVKTAFEGHSGVVAAADIASYGGPLPNTDVIVEFTNNLENVAVGDQPVWTDWSGLTGGEGHVVRWQRGVSG